MSFEFATATRIIFGPGAIRQVAPAAAALGRRALLVLGRNSGWAPQLLSDLQEQKISVDSINVTGEPSIGLIAKGVAQACQGERDLVIGYGGGSVIDTGKTIAALMTNGGEVLDYLEVIGRGKPLARPAIPYIAVPTTAGTGSEVTKNAVLSSPDHHVKSSLRSPFMLPRLAVIDPELTYSLPPAVTATSGLDALTQLIEPYVSNSANPITDAFCIQGLLYAARSLRQAYENGHDASAREGMSLASLFGGFALANAKLGVVHGLAGPLGGLFPAAHGALCARLLPEAMETNIRALQSRSPGSPFLERYIEVARLLTRQPEATATDGVRWVRALCADLSIQSLTKLGLTANALPVIVQQARNASSTRGNPILLTDQELMAILTQAMHDL